MSSSDESGFVPVRGCAPYEINRLGVVRSSTTKIERKWQQIAACWAVVLYVGLPARPSTKYIHRLMAEAFLERPSGWTEKWKAVFVNNDKTDMRLENIAWMDARRAYKHVRS